MKLFLYVTKTAFFAMMGGVLGLWLLQAIFAYLSELERLSDAYTPLMAFWYTIYRLPYFLIQFLGTGVLLGAVVGLGTLAGNSEIVVMRASGISLSRIVGWIMLPAFLFVIVSLLVNEYVLPKSQLLAKSIKNRDNTALILQEFWAMIPTKQGREIVNIGQADSEGNLIDVKKFDVQNGELVAMTYAKSGHYNEGYQWILDDIRKININHVATIQTAQNVNLELPIDSHSVHLLTKEADDLSISELHAYEQLMVHQKTHSKRHRLVFWQKLLSPFSVLSLVLVACSFVFGSLRSQSLGFRVVMALLTGLLFSYLTDLTGFISLVTSVPAVIMVLLPIIVSAGLGGYLLIKKE